MITWGWTHRSEPLEARAVLARGEGARRLVRRVLERERWALCVQVGPDLALVLGEDLPWVDGATWLGSPGDVPGVLLPTTLRPSLPEALVGRALRLEHPSGQLLLLPEELLVLGPQLPADAQRLRAWLEAP